MAVPTSPENLPAWRRSGCRRHMAPQAAPGPGAGAVGLPGLPGVGAGPGRAGAFLGRPSSCPVPRGGRSPSPGRGTTRRFWGSAPARLGLKSGHLSHALSPFPHRTVHFNTTRFFVIYLKTWPGTESCPLPSGVSILDICSGLTHLPPTKAAAILTLPTALSSSTPPAFSSTQFVSIF